MGPRLGLLLTVVAVGCGGGDPDGGCPSYMQLTGGTFSRSGTTLTWTLTVAAIPPILTFDRDGVPAFIAEYEWAIDLDSNRDGAADLQLSIVHFRRSGAAETVTGDILAITDEALWRVSGPASTRAGSIEVTRAGDAFTFIVDESDCERRCPRTRGRRRDTSRRARSCPRPRSGSGAPARRPVASESH